MKIVPLCLTIVGVIHLLPLQGILGMDVIFRLYDVTTKDNNVAILLVHRAVLFGLLGSFFIVSAFKPGLQIAAVISGLISTLSFIVIAHLYGPYNSALNTVVVADWIAIILLLVGGVTLINKRS